MEIWVNLQIKNSDPTLVGGWLIGIFVNHFVKMAFVFLVKRDFANHRES